MLYESYVFPQSACFSCFTNPRISSTEETHFLCTVSSFSYHQKILIKIIAEDFALKNP